MERLGSETSVSATAARKFEFRLGLHCDVGRKRGDNQDAFGYAQSATCSLFIVADGMGGSRGGATASTMTVNIVTKNTFDSNGRFSPQSLAAAILEANQTIFKLANEDRKLAGMGTTIVALGLIEDRAVVAHVGDSRIYQVSNGKLIQLTRDHSLIQDLLDSGTISEEEAENHPIAHMLTRSLGPTGEVEVDVRVVEQAVKPGDKFLLCSDGLLNHVRDDELREIIVSNDVFIASQRLLDLALERGGSDNITIQLVEAVIPGSNKVLELPTGNQCSYVVSREMEIGSGEEVIEPSHDDEDDSFLQASAAAEVEQEEETGEEIETPQISEATTAAQELEDDFEDDFDEEFEDDDFEDDEFEDDEEWEEEFEDADELADDLVETISSPVQEIEKAEEVKPEATVEAVPETITAAPTVELPTPPVQETLKPVVERTKEKQKKEAKEPQPIVAKDEKEVAGEAVEAPRRLREGFSPSVSSISVAAALVVVFLLVVSSVVSVTLLWSAFEKQDDAPIVVASRQDVAPPQVVVQHDEQEEVVSLPVPVDAPVEQPVVVEPEVLPIERSLPLEVAALPQDVVEPVEQEQELPPKRMTTEEINQLLSEEDVEPLVEMPEPVVEPAPVVVEESKPEVIVAPSSEPEVIASVSPIITRPQQEVVAPTPEPVVVQPEVEQVVEPEVSPQPESQSSAPVAKEWVAEEPEIAVEPEEAWPTVAVVGETTRATKADELAAEEEAQPVARGLAISRVGVISETFQDTAQTLLNLSVAPLPKKIFERDAANKNVPINWVAEGQGISQIKSQYSSGIRFDASPEKQAQLLQQKHLAREALHDLQQQATILISEMPAMDEIEAQLQKKLNDLRTLTSKIEKDEIEFRLKYQQWKEVSQNYSERKLLEVADRLAAEDAAFQRAFTRYNDALATYFEADQAWQKDEDNGALAAQVAAANKELRSAKADLDQEARSAVQRQVTLSENVLTEAGLLKFYSQSASDRTNRAIGLLQGFRALTKAQRFERAQRLVTEYNLKKEQLDAIRKVISDNKELELRKQTLRNAL